MTELSQVKVPCDSWDSGRTFWLKCRNCGFDRDDHGNAGELVINGDLFLADKLFVGKPVEFEIHRPEEKKVVAYNQRETTTMAHEYVLALPATAGDVQAAIQHALTDKRVAGFPVQTRDAVMVRTVNDEELIVYWEEVK